MRPTDILKHEHEVVLLVLKAAEQEVRNIASTGVIHPDFIRKVIDFSRNFTDGCHHAKEEKLLFVKMREKGMPTESGPVFVMEEEHKMGRKLIKTLEDNLPGAAKGDKGNIEMIRASLNDYVNLLRNHIYKENNILFNMADQMLPAEDQEFLLEEFDRIETEETGEGVHEKYHEMAHELANEAGL